MIRKLLCLLSWHEWIPQPNDGCSNKCDWFLSHYWRCDGCHFCRTVCKHCGKMKKR